jgi:hypothetical protein
VVVLATTLEFPAGSLRKLNIPVTAVVGGAAGGKECGAKTTPDQKQAE